MAEATTRAKRSLGANYRKVYVASIVSNLGDGVSQIGYPWLASAVTRNPILIALVAVAQRLPWLVFTLPAGVITDRVDRRKAMIAMDACRAVLTAAVAIAVLGLGSSLPDPDHLAGVRGTRAGLYLILVLSSLLLGFAEVLRDNSAQTIIPSIVDDEDLEKANGRMWSAEMVANTFAGPPLGSFLLAIAFALPFVLDAGSFAIAAGLMFLVTGQYRAKHVDPSVKPAPGAWKQELREGLSWLWRHPLLRPMAIILGIMNALGGMFQGTLVLYAQEVLKMSPFEFAILGTGGAIGGVIGGYVAPKARERLGSGRCLALTLGTGVVVPLAIGLTSTWPIVLAVFFVESLTAVLWNVITVSLRQAIIPDELLGRVNSVYRFFAWGMIPIGTAIGGIAVALTEPSLGRETALRVPWFAAAACAFALVFYAVPKLTTEKMEAARAAAGAPEAADS